MDIPQRQHVAAKNFEVQIVFTAKVIIDGSYIEACSSGYVANTRTLETMFAE
jgi:hypothetical protein